MVGKVKTNSSTRYPAPYSDILAIFSKYVRFCSFPSAIYGKNYKNLRSAQIPPHHWAARQPEAVSPHRLYAARLALEGTQGQKLTKTKLETFCILT